MFTLFSLTTMFPLALARPRHPQHSHLVRALLLKDRSSLFPTSELRPLTVSIHKTPKIIWILPHKDLHLQNLQSHFGALRQPPDLDLTRMLFSVVHHPRVLTWHCLTQNLQLMCVKFLLQLSVE